MVNYFYIITIQFQKSGSLAMSVYTSSGDVVVGTGETRQDVYHRVLKATAKSQDIPMENTGVLFFSLEPMAMNAVDLADLME